MDAMLIMNVNNSFNTIINDCVISHVLNNEQQPSTEKWYLQSDKPQNSEFKNHNLILYPITGYVTSKYNCIAGDCLGVVT